MPHVVRPIATIEDLAARARIAAQQATEVLQLPNLPFGGIDPCKVMAEFNDLLSAASLHLGADDVQDFRHHNLALAAWYGSGPSAYHCLQRVAEELERLASHIMDACGRTEPSKITV